MACGFYFFVNQNYAAYSQITIYLIFTQVLILTFLIPISFFYLLRSLGKIDSVMASDISQRKLPLFFQSLLFLILISKGTTLDRLPELFYYFLGGMISSLIAFLLIFFKTKASLHLLGLGSFFAFIISISIHTQTNLLNEIAVLMLIIGAVATSRLEMKAHDYPELTIGFLVGFIPQMVLWWFWV